MKELLTAIIIMACIAALPLVFYAVVFLAALIKMLLGKKNK